ncbi:hypothetical protein SSPO_011890 [Streptomyces antimycoticus]|uniref:Uncharacterized protein n=1 Tax=Streptomyces antimycoticus TaxID=68175 RepID=A0A499UMZ6_9ACTN|nr:hypothetical protein SSPO_011890 [Streptomyces antimycoticus]
MVAINPSKSTSYKELFPYRIDRAQGKFPIKRHPHAVVQLQPIDQPIEGNDRWIGFVVNMAAIPGEITKNPTVAIRYLDKAWQGTGALHAQDMAAARTAVVIGINSFERLNPQEGDAIGGAINSVGRKPELLMAVFGFVWTPRWVKGKRNRKVDIEEVRAAYQQLEGSNKRRAEANEKDLRDKGALPYGIFRDEVIRSEYTKSAVNILKDVNQQVHIVSQDADTGVAAISGVGVLRAYERVLTEMGAHPLLTIGGYHFDDFDWGRKADRRAKQLTRLANELDRAIRVGIAKKYPQMLYPTEPNLLIKAWDGQEGRVSGIFQDARGLALLEVQGPDVPARWWSRPRCPSRSPRPRRPRPGPAGARVPRFRRPTTGGGVHRRSSTGRTVRAGHATARRSAPDAKSRRSPAGDPATCHNACC